MNVLHNTVFSHYALAFRIESFSLRQPGWALLSVTPCQGLVIGLSWGAGLLGS